MKNSRSNMLIIVVFIFFLMGPSFIYFFVGDLMDDKNYEKRRIVAKPELTFKNIKKFPKEYEEYFNDTLAFKNEIRKYRSQVLYNIFKTSSNDRVILGKNDFLFYNSSANEDGYTIESYRKINEYTNDEKEQIKNNLVNTEKYLKEKDISFYVLVIPDKENAYGDYLPEIITVNKDRDISQTENLLDYLYMNSNIKIVYPKEKLVEGRKVRNTYLRYDTHWSDYGAYLGVMELMKTIDSNFEDIDITFKKGKVETDLAQTNLISDKVSNLDYVPKNFLDEVNVKCDFEEDYEVCTSNGKYDKNLVFIGDSFRYATRQFLSKLYTKAIFIDRDQYHDVVDKYNADIVVFEAVERYSYNLINAVKIKHKTN